MHSATDDAEYFHGFNNRKRIAYAIAEKEPNSITFELKKLSLARDCFLRRYSDTVDSNSASFLDLQIVSRIHREWNLEDAVRTHDTLVRHANSAYLGALALGFSSGARIPPSTDIQSNLDRSLYLQSWALAENQPNSVLIDTLRELIKSSLQKFKLHYPLRSFTELSKLAAVFGIRWIPSTLEDLPELAQLLTEKSWYIWGPELRLALLEMYTGCRGPHKHLVPIYGLELLGEKVRRLYAHANPIDQGSVGDPNDEQKDGSNLDLFSEQIKSKARRINWCGLDSGYFERAATLFDILNRSISLGKLEQAYKTFAHLYELDPSLMRFVDWERMHDSLPSFREAPSIAKCFVDVLFSKYGQALPRLRISRGDGVFIGSYSRIVDASRRANRTLRSIVQQIKTDLPPRAAEAFALYMLRADIVVDLHLKLPPPPMSEDNVEDELGKTEHLRAVQRIALAQQFVRQRFVEPKSCAGILEEERRCIALLKFRKALARGRIRLSQDSLQREARRFVEAVQPSLEFARKYSETVDARTANTFAPLIELDINALISRVFLNGPNALDKLLSSNIRHGWLTDRYQASFIRATRNTYDPQPNQAFNWEDEIVVEAMSTAYEAISSLKRTISLEVDTFKEQVLKVTEDHPRLTGLGGALQRLVAGSFAASEFVVSDLIEGVCHSLIAAASEALDDMRKSFDSDFAPKVLEMIDSCRSEVSRSDANKHSTFFDALISEVTATHRDISEWLKVAEDEIEFATFQASDLVIFETELVHLAALHELAIQTEFFEDQDGRRIRLRDLNLRGACFPVMTEVVHNLISNAIKHSGEGYKTKVTLTFVEGEKDLVLICRNSCSRLVSDKLNSPSELERIANLTRGLNDDLAAREGNSGFQKMVDICRHRLGIRAKISFQAPKPTRPHALVEVRLPTPGERWRAK